MKLTMNSLFPVKKVIFIPIDTFAIVSKRNGTVVVCLIDQFRVFCLHVIVGVYLRECWLNLYVNVRSGKYITSSNDSVIFVI